MADTDLPLEEFPESNALVAADSLEEKLATDLAPVFDVPVGISAVLGKATMSVAQPRLRGEKTRLFQIAGGRFDSCVLAAAPTFPSVAAWPRASPPRGPSRSIR